MRSEGYSTWVGLCVCPSVCLSVKSHLTSRMSNRSINERAYLLAYERQKICGDLPETTAFKSYAAKHKRKSQYANLPAYLVWCPDPSQKIRARVNACAREGEKGLVNNYASPRAKAGMLEQVLVCKH